MTKPIQPTGTKSLVVWGKDGKTFRRTVKMVLNKKQYEAWKKIGSPEVKKILEHIHEQRIHDTQAIINSWRASKESGDL